MSVVSRVKTAMISSSSAPRLICALMLFAGYKFARVDCSWGQFFGKFKTNRISPTMIEYFGLVKADSFVDVLWAEEKR